MILTLLVTLSFSVSLTNQAPLAGQHGSLGDEAVAKQIGQKSALTCDTCKVVVAVVQALLDVGGLREDIEKVAVYFCETFHIEDRNVCSSIIPLFSDEVLTVLDSVALSPDEACSILIAPSCATGYNPFDQPWNITLPSSPKPPVTPVPPPKPNSPVNRILHLSDMHFDPYYTPGLTNDCGEPLCCRVPNPPGNSYTAAGYWGDYNCDTPLQTLENLMEYLASIQESFDWVYLTGDLPPHNVWNQSRDYELSILNTTVALLRKYLPNKVVFPAVGNHESSPVNSFPPPYIVGNQSNQWLLNAFVDQWGVWLPDTALETLRWGGYYSAVVHEGLRVISLQTNYGNSENYWLLINSTDPAGQLAWLVEQLQAAEDNGEKVHIIGHIPPGDTIQWWRTNYIKIINRYESTIVGQFFGHTHHDSFSVFYDINNSTRPFSVVNIGGSVTTYQGINMGFHIYTVDGDYPGTTNALLNAEGYYMNLTDANLSNKPKWLNEYDAKSAYGMSSLGPDDWDTLITRLEQDDDLFTKFYSYYYKMNTPGPCDASCKAGLIDDLQTRLNNSPKNMKLPSGTTVDDVLRYRKAHKVC